MTNVLESNIINHCEIEMNYHTSKIYERGNYHLMDVEVDF